MSDTGDSQRPPTAQIEGGVERGGRYPQSLER